MLMLLGLGTSLSLAPVFCPSGRVVSVGTNLGVFGFTVFYRMRARDRGRSTRNSLLGDSDEYSIKNVSLVIPHTAENFNEPTLPTPILLNHAETMPMPMPCP